MLKQFRLRSVVILIALAALLIWAGQSIERLHRYRKWATYCQNQAELLQRLRGTDSLAPGFRKLFHQYNSEIAEKGEEYSAKALSQIHEDYLNKSSSYWMAQEQKFINARFNPFAYVQFSELPSDLEEISGSTVLDSNRYPPFIDVNGP